MSYNMTLVNDALKKAEQFEKAGNTKKRDYWFAFAERAEKAYKKLQENKLNT